MVKFSLSASLHPCPSLNTEDNTLLQDSPIGVLPPLNSILGVQSPTLHHVPKGVRDAWATLVGEVLASLVASPSVSCLCRPGVFCPVRAEEAAPTGGIS